MRSVPAAGAEFFIAFAAVPSLENNLALTVVKHIANNAAAFFVLNHGAERQPDFYIRPALARAVFGIALASVFGKKFVFELKIYKAGFALIRD